MASLEPQNRYRYSQPSTREFTVGLHRLGTLTSVRSADFEFQWLIVSSHLSHDLLKYNHILCF
jgi:hypothetical protein